MTIKLNICEFILSRNPETDRHELQVCKQSEYLFEFGKKYGETKPTVDTEGHPQLK